MAKYYTPLDGSPPQPMPEGSMILKVQRLKVVGPDNDPMGNIRLMVYSVLSTVGSVFPSILPFEGELKDNLGNKKRAHFLCKKQGKNFTVLGEVAPIKE
jgi:hypothetical protein